MASGRKFNWKTEPIEPTQVWTQEEWRRKQPWGSMPSGDLRRFLKDEGFIHIYGGGPNKFRDLHEKYSFPTGRFTTSNPPIQPLNDLERKVTEFLRQEEAEGRGRIIDEQA